MKIIYHILNSKGVVISSNMPSDFPFKKEDVVERIKIAKCPNTGINYRHGFFSKPEGSIYLACYNEKITNKILRRYFDSCFFFLPGLIASEKEFREKEHQNFRRLKHNLVTHNTNILQEIEKQIPSYDFPKGGKNQIEFVQEIIKDNGREIAISIMKIMKSANLMKSDFDVYDMLISKNPYLEFDMHNIHKIILQILNPFWLEFIEKGVFIDMNDCHELVCIDYKSISVVLTHLFENSVKYIAPNTSLKIRFEDNKDDIVVCFGMTSLKMTNADLKKIFESNYSGEFSEILGINGSGLGLNVVKQLLMLNNGDIEIKANVNPETNIMIHGVPYERNRFYIKLNKSSAEQCI